MLKITKQFFRNNAARLTWVFFILSMAVLVGAGGCEKTTLPEEPSTEGQQILLDKQQVVLTVGEQTTLELGLENGNKFNRRFEFSSSNPEVATVERVSGYVVRVLAKKMGTTVINFVSEDGAVNLSANVTVNDYPPDGITRILAIGNSFSEDAIENYLYNIATSNGDSVIIANLYIGGSSLADHVRNANENNKVYSYRKISKTGAKTTRDNVSISDVLNDERWDYISFQQVSQNSGQLNTWESSLPALYNFVKDRVAYSRTKYVLHQTWAYGQNSTHDGFANYGRDQMTMYNAIADATQKAAQLVPIDVVVPAGTAIQNGRTSFWGDNFTRDGYHLDVHIGRYLAAATWYEALFDKSVVGNSYDPNLFALSSIEREMAQHAAAAAVNAPYQVTDLADYKSVQLADLSKAVLIDVAQEVEANGWNGLRSPEANTKIPYLRNYEGDLTRASLTITERFNNVNTNGMVSNDLPIPIPASVGQRSYYGNIRQEFSGLLVLQSAIRISGLDPAMKYSLCYYASRCCVSDNRETKFTAKGANEVVTRLVADNNNSKVACTDGVSPDANGNITITITAGENNNNNIGFYYLNAMSITQQ